MLRTSREGWAHFQAAALSQEGNLEVSGARVTAGTGTGSCCARAAPCQGIHSTGAFLCQCHRGNGGGQRAMGKRANRRQLPWLAGALHGLSRFVKQAIKKARSEPRAKGRSSSRRGEPARAKPAPAWMPQRQHTGLGVGIQPSLICVITPASPGRKAMPDLPTPLYCAPRPVASPKLWLRVMAAACS